ncbi:MULTISPECIES: fluoride efflux transporter CrcB [Bacillaceae]|uniref:fluoride efflux transporter CrcB n=1 Tax=Bacillaceae TaxID=186817 RepID=UPI000BEDDAD0|nr:MULTISPECIES: fluoride efflux transporter CrcB [unclassified Bacillus (in: firmicutes)]PEC48522.1 fluoride efflux transporter CrcB [Bacillus sp. AFS096315]PFM81049.1 fluoride efflux transporter CrcB [Bacillus sp. AFS077874]
MNYLFILIGGFFGAILRYLIGLSIHPLSNGFPIQTFLINIIGCFFLGFFLPMAKVKLKPEYTLLIGTGFTGAFTTFSTFSLENVALMDEKKLLISLVYIISSLVIGISLAYLGFKGAEKFNKVKGETSS